MHRHMNTILRRLAPWVLIAAIWRALSSGLYDSTGRANVDVGGATLNVDLGSVTIEDATNHNNKAAVQQFHNADNQAPGGSAYGLLTGGVAQLVNAAGNLDRQRETSVDGQPAQGIVTGAQQMAMPFATTCPSTIAAGTRAITPVAMSGTTRGAAWSIQMGSQLSVDTGANNEVVTVVSVTATTFTAVFAKAHTATWSMTGFVYNQARDAAIADGSSPAGISASAAYLWNSGLNSGSGGVEFERSAAGELDGASGTGTAVAAEYEYNAGDPGGGNYDRARNVNAKGVTTSTIASIAGAAVTLNNAQATPPVGAKVLLTGGTAPEAGTVLSVAGQVVTLTANATYTNQANLVFDTFAAQGPQTSGFTPFGIGVEEEAIWDPVSHLFYLERAATQDAASGQNLAMESLGVYNGSTFDRLKGTNGAAYTVGSPGPQTTGNLTAAAQPITATGLGGFDGVTITYSGTYATGATLVFEASNDAGTSWQAVQARRMDTLAGGSQVAPNASASATYAAYIAGCSQFRVRASAFGASGTIAVTITPYSGATTETALAQLFSSNTAAIANINSLSADANTMTGTSAALWTFAMAGVFNGTSWDRGRSLGAAGDGIGVQLVTQPSSTPATGQATHAVNTVTAAAVASQKNRLTHLSGSVSGSGTMPTAAAPMTLTVKDGTTLIFSFDLVAGGGFTIPLPQGGIKGSTNTALNVALPDGGANVTTSINIATLTA